MATKAIDWKTNYRAVFGALSDQQADAWSRFAGENLDGLGIDEMDLAVAVLCDSWPFDSNRKPSVRDVCRTIRDMRLRKRGIQTEIPFPVRQLRDTISRTDEDGTLRRWDLVCGGVAHTQIGGPDWAAWLERHAVKHGGLTVPWWAATPTRFASCRVLTRDEFLASVDEATAAIYRAAGVCSLAELTTARTWEDAR